MEKKWPAVYDIEMMKMEAWEGFKHGQDDFSEREKKIGFDKITQDALRREFIKYWEKRLKVLGLR